MNKLSFFFILIGLFVLIDQVVKIYIKTSFYLGEWIKITNWFYIHFIENPGMAFGLEIGGEIGKVILSLLRFFISIILIWYAIKVIKENPFFKFIIPLAMIIGGALGNLIDSLFYGVIFTQSTPTSKSVFAPFNGYSYLLMGNVVDYLYFPIIRTTLPHWFPIYGGEEFIFFRPVFNIADALITVGVILYILVNLKVKKHAPRYQSDLI